MNITNVKFRKTAEEGKLRAIVSITFDNELVVHDVKIIEGEDKFFLAMPSRKSPDGSFRDIVHPINSDIRRQLEDDIITRYKSSLENAPEA